MKTILKIVALIIMISPICFAGKINYRVPDRYGRNSRWEAQRDNVRMYDRKGRFEGRMQLNGSRINQYDKYGKRK